MSDVHSGGYYPGDHAHEHDPHPPAAGPHPADSAEFDQELNLRAIIWTTVGLLATCVVSVLAMWGLIVGFDVFDRHHAAPPSAMAPPAPEAGRQPPEPQPALQPSPPDDMAAMRADEDAAMDHARWVDRGQGTVRVPIDVALDVVASRGLPKVTTPPLAEMAAHGSMADEGRPPTDQPSPGTLLPPPGLGIGNLGPPSAGAGQQVAPAMPEEPLAQGAPGAQAAPGATAAPAATPAAAAAAGKPAAKPATTPRGQRPPVLPPPPPPPGRLP